MNEAKTNEKDGGSSLELPNPSIPFTSKYFLGIVFCWVSNLSTRCSHYSSHEFHRRLDRLLSLFSDQCETRTENIFVNGIGRAERKWFRSNKDLHSQVRFTHNNVCCVEYREIKNKQFFVHLKQRQRFRSHKICTWTWWVGWSAHGTAEILQHRFVRAEQCTGCRQQVFLPFCCAFLFGGIHFLDIKFSQIKMWDAWTFSLRSNQVRILVDIRNHRKFISKSIYCHRNLSHWAICVEL